MNEFRFGVGEIVKVVTDRIACEESVVSGRERRGKRVAQYRLWCWCGKVHWAQEWELESLAQEETSE